MLQGRVPRKNKGFTLVELMITLVIVAIGVGLAVPSYRHMLEKRKVVAGAESVVSFIGLAQSLAIKSNQRVGVSWWTEGDDKHEGDFCMGISSPPKTVPCDCLEEVQTETDFCAIDASLADAADGTPYRLTKIDFVNLDFHFMHFWPYQGNFSFDPVRGTMDSWSDNDVVNGDRFGRMHSNLMRGTKTLFALNYFVDITGRTRICSDSTEPMFIAAYPAC